MSPIDWKSLNEKDPQVTAQNGGCPQRRACEGRSLSHRIRTSMFRAWRILPSCTLQSVQTGSRTKSTMFDLQPYVQQDIELEMANLDVKGWCGLGQLCAPFCN